MTKAHLKLVAPSIIKRTVIPTRLPNATLRTREHLTEAEVERLMEVARKNRWGHRDATMIMTAYRHGFRPAELVDLQWQQIEFASAALHVRRVKRGTPSTHPILGDELRALRRLQREQEPKSPFVFTSERGTPFTTAGFARMVERAGAWAPQHSAHRALHRAVADAVQGFLAGLSECPHCTESDDSRRRFAVQRCANSCHWQPTRQGFCQHLTCPVLCCSLSASQRRASWKRNAGRSPSCSPTWWASRPSRNGRARKPPSN